MSDSDNFLNDIQETVTNPSVDDPSTDNLTPNEPNDDARDIENSVLNHLGDTVDDIQTGNELTETDKSVKTEDDSKKEKETKPDEQQQQQQQQQQSDKTKEVEKNVETKKQTNTQETNKRSPLDKFLSEDKNNNLTLADGTIIAAAGVSRQFYEDLKKEGRTWRDRFSQLTQQAKPVVQALDRLRKENEDLKAGGLNNLSQVTGMSTNEVNDAIKFMTEYKKNPLEGIKMVLTSAKMNGIDLSSLGAESVINPNTITNIVKEQITDLIKPLIETNQAQTAQQAYQEEAGQFYKDFPDAERYKDYIARGKQEYPNSSHTEIWAHMIRYGLEKFDAEIDANTVQNTTQDTQENKQQDVTKDVEKVQQQPAPQQQQQHRPAPKNKPQRSNYTNLSYDEIASTIMKDLNVNG